MLKVKTDHAKQKHVSLHYKLAQNPASPSPLNHLGPAVGFLLILLSLLISSSSLLSSARCPLQLVGTSSLGCVPGSRFLLWATMSGLCKAHVHCGLESCKKMSQSYVRLWRTIVKVRLPWEPSWWRIGLQCLRPGLILGLWSSPGKG